MDNLSSESIHKRKRKSSEEYQHQDLENLPPSKRQFSPTIFNSQSSLNSSHAPVSSSSSCSISSSTSSGTVISSIVSSGSSTVLPASSNSSNINTSPSDTQTSSSDCFSTAAEFDLATLSSPPASILACDENFEKLLSESQTTPHGTKRNVGYKSKNTCFVTPSAELRLCPLPLMSFADSSDVWKLMCRKDAKGSLERDPCMLQYHPGLQPRMRAILLDWLMEVCEVYKLQRETYYLAVDYLDRFLSARTMKINKTHLQLIGITCLFVAAKVEEIYPPKIGEFAYVTDSACTEEDIINQEAILLKALNWYISPVTIVGWLSIYMQINTTSNLYQKPSIKIDSSNRNNNNNNLSNCSNNKNSSKSNKISNCTKEYYTTSNSSLSAVKFINRNDDAFVYPQFSGMEFVHTAQLIDLCTLDVGLANFPYSVIAAAAMSHTFDRKTAVSSSGLEWQDIETCAKWMEPFYHVLCEDAQPMYLLESNEQVKSSYGLRHVCPNINTDDSHILQTHAISLNMFEKVTIRKEELIDSESAVSYQEVSPAVIETKCPDGLLTPPASSRKPLDSNLDVETDIQQNNQNKII